MIQLKPPPCHVPDPPASADPASLELLATPKGVGVWMTVADWKAQLHHAIDDQAAWTLAKLCEVP
jgi:hypothetical protein